MTFRTFLCIFLFSFFSVQLIAQSSEEPWSVRMAESIMADHPNWYGNWDYVTGTVLRGFEELWEHTGDDRFFDYIKSTVDHVVTSNGNISDYNIFAYNIDEIKEGRMLLLLYQETGDERYQIAAGHLRDQLEDHPRTSEGGFWHKQIYPWQMWLDGLYMGSPFYAEYSLIFDEPEGLDDVVLQQVLMETHARDPETGLLYHGWDESMQQEWSDPVTGQSPSFWGRAIGWYAMALVDVLDYLPPEHEGRDTVISIYQRLVEGMMNYQDESGTWWQVVDKGGDPGNYLESSVSCMMVYSMAKAIRYGYISVDYLPDVLRAYHGIIDQFITYDPEGTINLIQTCSSAGLGGNPYRDGSYEYYVYQTSISTNDGKGLGPFIAGSVELERLCVPENLAAVTLSDSSISLSWEPMTGYFDSLQIFRVEAGELLEINTLSVEETMLIDSGLEPLTVYEYRVRPVVDGVEGVLSPTVQASTLGPGGRPAYPLNPFPANQSEGVATDIELSWQSGEGAAVQKIYLGTTNPPALAGSQTSSSVFDPEGLNPATTYYWRIDGENDNGATEGPLWIFTTEALPGIVAHWPLDEGEGSVIEDALGNNSGSLFNHDETIWGTLGSNPHLQFDGVDDYAVVPHSELLDFGSESFSISFWLKQSVQDRNMRYIIKGTHYNPGTGKRYEVFHHLLNQVRFVVDDDQVKTSLTVDNIWFVTGDWVHVVAVRDVENDQLKLYANTVLKGVTTDNTGSISQDEDLVFGDSPDETDNYLEGSLDDIRFYNYAISDSLIQVLFDEHVYTEVAEPFSQDKFDFEVFPNPSKGFINIQYHIPENVEAEVTVFSSDGLKVMAVQEKWLGTGGGMFSIDIQNHPKGIYYVKIVIGDFERTIKCVLTE